MSDTPIIDRLLSERSEPFSGLIWASDARPIERERNGFKAEMEVRRHECVAQSKIIRELRRDLDNKHESWRNTQARLEKAIKERDEYAQKHHDAELRCLDLAKRLTSAENESASARRTLEAFGCQKLGDTWVAPGKSVEGSFAWYRDERDRLSGKLTEAEGRVNTARNQIDRLEKRCDYLASLAVHPEDKEAAELGWSKLEKRLREAEAGRDAAIKHNSIVREAAESEKQAYALNVARAETNVRHWREECGKLDAQLRELQSGEAVMVKYHLPRPDKESEIGNKLKELGWKTPEDVQELKKRATNAENRVNFLNRRVMEQEKEITEANELHSFKANLAAEIVKLQQVIADCPLFNPEHSMGDERNWTARAKATLETP